ncbi:HDOD domain-containing protein [Hippea maritima]|uniref:Putative signal transduction protein n=1 Tax=Hippea maritima (strain ATCC 700847 / DSM 10411 / MH2) TaxID=760142 RepID=F2LUC7_HIPMA|nr:HDOD domain-containing protein [Hippea maritima]AEA33453.1 putative signal transduction protein [Hippea maritima DSM 10411]
MSKEKEIIIIFDDPLRGFAIIKKLQESGFKTNSFKLSNLLVDKINKDAAAVIFLFKKPLTGITKTIEKLKRHLNKAYFIAISSQNFAFWEKSGVDYIAKSPSMVLGVLSKQKEKPKLDVPINSQESAEKILRQYKNRIRILVFRFENFSDENILSMAPILKSVYNNLKRADGFLIIENFGFIVIPYNQNETRGIEILLKKIESFIKENKTDEMKVKLSFLGIVEFNPSKDSLNSITENIKAKEDIAKYLKPQTQTQYTSLEELLMLPFIVNSAIETLNEETVAHLYYDPEFRKIVSPFINLKSARRIAQLKGKASAVSIEKAKEKFIENLKDIGKFYDKNRKNEFLSTLTSNIQLFSLPEVQSNIIMLINEEAPFKKIINEIQKDAAITTKILKFANSAFFGLKREIKSIEKAAIMLGTEEILGISLSISYLNFFNSSYTKKLYKYSIACLSISKFIEEQADINTGATLASVIHSIGDMFYAQYHPDEYKRFIDYIEEEKIPYEVAELKFLPAASVNVGYELAILWNLPKRIRKTIKYYLYPAVKSKMDSALHLIHASSVIAKALGYFYGNYSIDNLNYHTYNLFLNKFKVNLLTMFEKHRETIEEKINDMVYILS